MKQNVDLKLVPSVRAPRTIVDLSRFLETYGLNAHCSVQNKEYVFLVCKHDTPIVAGVSTSLEEAVDLVVTAVRDHMS